MNNFPNFSPNQQNTDELLIMFEVLNKILLIAFVLSCQNGFCQDTALGAQATLPAAHLRPNTKRVYMAAAGSVVFYGASLAALSNTWYTQYPQSSFHFFNDNNDWLQMDKAGHAFSAYTTGKMSMELWRWAGLSRRQQIWAGGLSGAGFLTVIEFLDGFSSAWGFSIGDMSANLAGSGLFIAQQLAWDEQRIQLKFSFHTNNYRSTELSQRADALFGRRTVERMLKDYNAQTYWLSINLKSFAKKSKLPAWLNMDLGYGAEGMFGGTENVLKDANGNILFDRRDIPRIRKWYLSPDIDLTRIKTKSRFLKTTFFLLNSLKFPAPAIVFSKKGVEWSWVHF